MRVDVDNLEPRNFDRGPVRVIKNFLPRTLFKELQKVVMGGDFPWVFCPYTVKLDYYGKKSGKVIESYTDGNFMFNHHLVKQDYSSVKKYKEVKTSGVIDQIEPTIRSPYYKQFSKILPYIQESKPYSKLMRLKMNLYPNQNRYIDLGKHRDIGSVDKSGKDNFDDYFIGILHFNTCNGLTIVKNEKIKSEENQMLLFENVEHHGTVQTDTKARIVLNFNFKK